MSDIILASKDGKLRQSIADTDVNRAEITRLRSLGWSEPKPEPKPEPNPDGTVDVDYWSLRVDDLRAEVDQRNADRDTDGDDYLSRDGLKADLVAELEADDEREGGDA